MQIFDLAYAGQGIVIWSAVCLILAIIGAIAGYFLFIKPEKKQENKTLAWLKDFFSFKKMLIEDLLKICYAFLAIYITLVSFGFISLSFLLFLAWLIFGNLVARLIYEAALILIMIWKNTNEINKKMSQKK